MAQARQPTGIEVFRPLGRGAVVSTTARGDVVGEEPRRSRLLGVGAVLLALVFAGVHAGAVIAASGNEFERATTLATLAIIGTGITALLGLTALFAGFGRRAGLVAIVLSLLANPLVLTALLSWLDTATGSASS
jgi:hypothetical protein